MKNDEVVNLFAKTIYIKKSWRCSFAVEVFRDFSLAKGFSTSSFFITKGNQYMKHFFKP